MKKADEIRERQFTKIEPAENAKELYYYIIQEIENTIKDQKINYIKLELNPDEYEFSDQTIKLLKKEGFVVNIIHESKYFNQNPTKIFQVVW